MVVAVLLVLTGLGFRTEAEGQERQQGSEEAQLLRQLDARGA